MPNTLWHCWHNNALERGDAEAVVHWIPGKEPVRWTFGALYNKACCFAMLLKDKGIREGDVCALMLRHHPLFYPLYMGVSLLGAIPAVLAYPNPRLHPDKFRQGITGMAQRSGLDYLLTETELMPLLEPLIKNNTSTIKGFLFPLTFTTDGAVPSNFSYNTATEETAPLLLQHSSGTTGLQKPVMVTHKMLLTHAAAYRKTLKPLASDKVVSWLPLYHDMGLMAAFHLPMLYGITSIHISPFDWVTVPELFIEAVHWEKATLTWFANFAFNLMVDKINEEDIKGMRLDSLRLIVNGGEMIRKKSHDAFLEKFEKFGLRKDIFGCIYGMAEATMAVIQTPTGEKPAEVSLNTEALKKGQVLFDNNPTTSRIWVSSGRLVEGCEIKVLDSNRAELPPASIGEIAVKSLSLFNGYRNYPEKTAAVMHKGWYLSGDLGFEKDSDYYIIGRKKDLIISAGKNIYPEDIEDAASAVPGVIPGRVVAFGYESDEAGTELIGVIAETLLTETHERQKLKMDILKAVMAIDVTVSEVFLVPPRWLIKSSAGKPGRATNKERILSYEGKKWKII